MGPVTFPEEAIEASWGLHGSTHFVRVRGRHHDPSLTPVVMLHGQPGDEVWSETLTGQAASQQVLSACLAAGYTVWAPFTGRNWGHPTNLGPPGTGGTGLTAIDDIHTATGADRVHLSGVSMGGVNAFVWAWNNPGKVASIRIYAAVWSLVNLYDFSPDFAASLDTVYGSTDRASFLVASADYDPVRNAEAVAPVGPRVSMLMARDDTVVGWEGLDGWAAAAQVGQLQPSAPPGSPGGGHLFWAAGADYNEFDALEWFTVWESGGPVVVSSVDGGSPGVVGPGVVDGGGPGAGWVDRIDGGVP